MTWNCNCCKKEFEEDGYIPVGADFKNISIWARVPLYFITEYQNPRTQVLCDSCYVLENLMKQ